MIEVYTNELSKRNFKEYASIMYSEDELLRLANIILEKEFDIELFLYELMYAFSRQFQYSKELDWNIGSTLQHFQATSVIAAFRKIDTTQKTFLYDSIGLSWVFGEFGIKDPIVIEFLYDVVKKSRDSEAWWRAAFSLEKLGEEEAIIFLKRSLMIEGIKPLQFYLDNLQDKKSIIGVLLHSNSKYIRDEIHPALKSTFLGSTDKRVLINCAWLLGRYKLINSDIFKKMVNLIDNNDDYELTYYTFTAIQEIASLTFLPIFKKYLTNKDPLLRKMAIRGISYLENNSSLAILEQIFLDESNPSVISEISKGIYRIKNAKTKEKLYITSSYNDIENGLIIDESDKWYADPEIYESFSMAEDPENLCFNLILKEISNRLPHISNPIDLATGTGRAIRFFLGKIDYSGHFYAVDKSKEMLNFLDKTINRKHAYVFPISLCESSIIDLNLKGIKSNFVISSFGFPSKIGDREQCLNELYKVYELLSDDGIFVSVGWDETFNDELNHFWFKYIPDSVGGYDYEAWRKIKRSKILSTRNCNLKWFKTGINVPLQFHNLKESAHVMGHLFGRDCAKFIIDNNKLEWSMSLGITLNTKNEIRDILNKGI